eukprot:687854-Pleurochrysis_carterae.AAC.1
MAPPAGKETSQRGHTTHLQAAAVQEISPKSPRRGKTQRSKDEWRGNHPRCAFPEFRKSECV